MEEVVVVEGGSFVSLVLCPLSLPIPNLLWGTGGMLVTVRSSESDRRRLKRDATSFTVRDLRAVEDILSPFAARLSFFRFCFFTFVVVCDEEKEPASELSPAELPMSTSLRRRRSGVFPPFRTFLRLTLRA